MNPIFIAHIIESLHNAFGPTDQLPGTDPVDPGLVNKGSGISKCDHTIAGVWGKLSRLGIHEDHASCQTHVAAVLASAPTWLCAALKENALLAGIIADMERDGGIEQGRREERRRVVEILDNLMDRAVAIPEPTVKHTVQSWLTKAQDEVFGRGTLDITKESETLPHIAMLQEILRLRKALHEIRLNVKYGHANGTLERVVEIVDEALGGVSGGS